MASFRLRAFFVVCVVGCAVDASVFRLVLACATTTFDAGADDCARLFAGVVVVVVFDDDFLVGGG